MAIAGENHTLIRRRWVGILTTVIEGGRPESDKLLGWEFMFNTVLAETDRREPEREDNQRGRRACPLCPHTRCPTYGGRGPRQRWHSSVVASLP